MTIETDVLVIGAGLSGLMLAHHLKQAGINYHLLEARGCPGGRIKAGQFAHGEMKSTFDLGPSWFWPGQSRIQSLVEELSLEVFVQYSEGEQLFEDREGNVFANRGYASMEGSYRINGGMIELINRLFARLPSTGFSFSTIVGRLLDKGEYIEACSKEGVVIANAQRVVLAMPPRVSTTLDYQPSLPESVIETMLNIPTWMAGHAKFIAVYETPFWREQGMSGDAMSALGPLAEIHDACDPDSSLGALFGFVGIPAYQRKDQSTLKSVAVRQLGRIFGEPALTPLDVVLQDWALEPETAIEADQRQNHGHPAYGLPHNLKMLWGGRLMLGSTEVAPTFGGYLEGALEAAEHTTDLIIGQV